MLIRRIVIAATFAVSVTALSLSPAKAQDCSFPLAWPFCIAGAAVYTAGAVATAPFRPYYYYGSPYYYYAPVYYGPRSRYYHRKRHHYPRYY